MPMVHPYFHAWSAVPSQEGTPKAEQAGVTFLLACAPAGPAQGSPPALVRCPPRDRGWNARARPHISSGLPVLGLRLRAFCAQGSCLQPLCEQCPGHCGEVPTGPALCGGGQSDRAEWVEGDGAEQGPPCHRLGSSALGTEGHTRAARLWGGSRCPCGLPRSKGLVLQTGRQLRGPFPRWGALCLEPCGAHGPLTFGMTPGGRVSCRGPWTLPGREQGSGRGRPPSPAPGLLLPLLQTQLVQMVVWMLQHRLLVQLHTYVCLMASPREDEPHPRDDDVPFTARVSGRSLSTPNALSFGSPSRSPLPRASVCRVGVGLGRAPGSGSQDPNVGSAGSDPGTFTWPSVHTHARPLCGRLGPRTGSHCPLLSSSPLKEGGRPLSLTCLHVSGSEAVPLGS